MQNVFANRQNMHLAVLRLLDSPEIPFDWKTASPAAFAAKAAELRPKVTALTGLLAQQQAATTGFAADKAREEQELETLAHELSQALAGWFQDHGREADAAPIDLALSTWQRLPDTDLLAKAQLLHTKLTGALAAGPPPSPPSPPTAWTPPMPPTSPRKPPTSSVSSPIPPPPFPAASPSPPLSGPRSPQSPTSSPRWTA